MPKYEVRLTVVEHHTYDVEVVVEAASADEAEKMVERGEVLPGDSRVTYTGLSDATTEDFWVVDDGVKEVNL